MLLVTSHFRHRLIPEGERINLTIPFRFNPPAAD